MSTFVYDFAEGNKDQKDLLGGKGANLAEMTNSGCPCRRASPSPPRPAAPTSRRATSLTDWPTRSPSTSRSLEEAMGRRLGDADDPLLVSVRSGAKFSMPGMMETVLNVGLNDESVQRPPRRQRQRAVRRGLLPAADPDVRRHRARTSTATSSPPSSTRSRSARAPTVDTDLDADDLSELVETFKERFERAHRPRLPAGPARADGPRDARGLRLLEHRPRRPLPPPGADPRRPRHRRQRAGDGVRQPGRRLRLRRLLHPRPRLAATRASTATTCRTPRARTSSRASATRCRWPTSSAIDKTSYDELLAIMDTLEQHYRDMCDIEFTVERGKLWMLQTRVGKRTPEAAFRIALPHDRRGPDRRRRGHCAGSPAPSWRS